MRRTEERAAKDVSLQHSAPDREAIHLKTLANMLPWFFAYNHVNYARYLPLYLSEMQTLPTTHPSVAESISEHFAVQQQENHGFAQTAMDQVIEQTCNRDTKTKGGLIGFTQNPAAVQRWILSHGERANITAKCLAMAGTTAKEKNPVSQTRADSDELLVKVVMDTFKTLQNPFTYNVSELVNIASGLVVSYSAQTDILSAYEKGADAAEKFVAERLASDTTDFQAPVKQTKLQSFSSTPSYGKDQPKPTAGEKVGKDIISRLLVVARDRQLDLKELLFHNLAEYPPSISGSNGALQRTNKSSLLHFFTAQVPECFLWTGLHLGGH